MIYHIMHNFSIFGALCTSLRARFSDPNPFWSRILWRNVSMYIPLRIGTLTLAMMPLGFKGVIGTI